MNSLTTRSALVALLVAAPLSGAFAGDMGDRPDYNSNRAAVVDTMTTSSIGNAASAHSLQSRIRAAEANLAQVQQDAGNPAEVTRLRAEISAIRQEARSGLDAASAERLSQQLSEIQSKIYAL